MDIDWSEYKRSQSYRIKVDSYLAGKKLEATQPRREWQPARVSANMITLCAKRGLDVRNMTAIAAAAALKAHTKPVTHNPKTYNPATATPAQVEAYLNFVFGPV